MLSRLASELKSKIQVDIDNNQQQLIDLSFKIHSNPEIGFKEYKASNWLTQHLENNGFSEVPAPSGIGFHHFHLESDEQNNLINPVNPV